MINLFLMIIKLGSARLKSTLIRMGRGQQPVSARLVYLQRTMHLRNPIPSDCCATRRTMKTLHPQPVRIGWNFGVRQRKLPHSLGILTCFILTRCHEIRQPPSTSASELQRRLRIDQLDYLSGSASDCPSHLYSSLRIDSVLKSNLHSCSS